MITLFPHYEWMPGTDVLWYLQHEINGVGEDGRVRVPFGSPQRMTVWTLDTTTGQKTMRFEGGPFSLGLDGREIAYVHEGYLRVGSADGNTRKIAAVTKAESLNWHPKGDFIAVSRPDGHSGCLLVDRYGTKWRLDDSISECGPWLDRSDIGR